MAVIFFSLNYIFCTSTPLLLCLGVLIVPDHCPGDEVAGSEAGNQDWDDGVPNKDQPVHQLLFALRRVLLVEQSCLLLLSVQIINDVQVQLVR